MNATPSPKFDASAEQAWFEPATRLQPAVLPLAEAALHANAGRMPHSVHAIEALHFLGYGMSYLETANRAGHHAVALSLLRQCIDPLFLIECGLIGDGNAAAALAQWHGRCRMGDLRKKFGAPLWAQYTGLYLGRTWPDFMSDMYKSVQEYAHYNPTMLQWSMSAVAARATVEGPIHVTAKTWSYDAEQATRITLLQMIILGCIAHMLKLGTRLGHIEVGGFEDSLASFEAGLSQSKIAALPFDWTRELLGLTIPLSVH